MTQTIRKFNKSNDTVEIWYHPNNACGKTTDAGARHCYDCYIKKMDAAEAFRAEIEEAEMCEDCQSGETMRRMAELLGEVWRVSFSNDQPDEHYRTKQDAIDAIGNQFC
jgi:hypothetical protein